MYEGKQEFKKVQIRADRVCWHCGKTIQKGTSCLTINPRFERRHWLCNGCFLVYKSILEAKSSLDIVPFDDEGAAYTNADYLDQVVSEWEESQCGADTSLDLYIQSIVY